MEIDWANVNWTFSISVLAAAFAAVIGICLYFGRGPQPTVLIADAKGKNPKAMQRGGVVWARTNLDGSNDPEPWAQGRVANIMEILPNDKVTLVTQDVHGKTIYIGNVDIRDLSYENLNPEFLESASPSGAAA